MFKWIYSCIQKYLFCVPDARVHPEYDRNASTASLIQDNSKKINFFTSAASNIKKSISSIFLEHSEPINIFVLTWNLGGKVPNIPLDEIFGSRDSLLDAKLYRKCQLLVIGVQECGPIEQATVFPQTKEWNRILSDYLDSEYRKIKTEALGAMNLTIYVKKDYANMIKDVKCSRIGTGLGNILGNKGGVAISFNFTHMSLLFINCHFSAHSSKVERRNKDYRKISQELVSIKSKDKKNSSLIDQFDGTFWLGDLNYRVLLTRTEVDDLLDQDSLDLLLAMDELNIERQKGTIFNGFYEAEIKFKPTYKFDTGTKKYDTSAKQRIPSWTDRILYAYPKRSLFNFSFQSDKNAIECLEYNSIQNVFFSDHEPVYGIYSIGPH